VYYLKGLEKRDNLSALLNKQHFRAIAPAEIAKTLIYENKAR